MTYPLRIPGQLKPHLRALRNSRGLTQAQLGALVGVKQARIAEIEANPGAVSLDQLVKVLAALGATLQLHAVEADGGRRVPAKTVSSPQEPHLEPVRRQRKVTKANTPRTGVVIPAKKGVW